MGFALVRFEVSTLTTFDTENRFLHFYPLDLSLHGQGADNNWQHMRYHQFDYAQLIQPSYEILGIINILCVIFWRLQNILLKAILSYGYTGILPFLWNIILTQTELIVSFMEGCRHHRNVNCNNDYNLVYNYSIFY